MQMSKNIYFKYRHIFKYFILNVSIILTPFCAIAGFFGPSSYSDCVEKYVKGAKCDNAVFILNRTCIMQFDENKNFSTPKCREIKKSQAIFLFIWMFWHFHLGN